MVMEKVYNSFVTHVENGNRWGGVFKMQIQIGKSKWVTARNRCQSQRQKCLADWKLFVLVASGHLIHVST